MVSETDYIKNIPETPTFCALEEKPKLQLINTNALSHKVYQDFTEKVQSFDFLDHFALWTLLQMSVRPDQSSPTARFQVLIKLKDESVYLDFFSESPQKQYPLLFGLEWILTKYKKKSSLESYAAILDRQFSQK